jgi:hypothetical protein
MKEIAEGGSSVFFDMAPLDRIRNKIKEQH